MSEPPEDPVAFAEEGFARLVERNPERILELVHPNVTFIPLLAGVEGGTYHGHDGVRRWLEDIEAAWSHYRPSLDRVEALAGDVVLIAFTLELRGRESEIDVVMPAFMVGRRDATSGLLIEWHVFDDEGVATATAAQLAAAER